MALRIDHGLLSCLMLGAVSLGTTACSDSSTPATDSGVSDSGDTGVSDSRPADSSPSDSAAADSAPDDGGAACPATVPTGGVSCAPEGLACEYGDDPRPECHMIADCVAGVFVIDASMCTPLPDVTCPATREDAAGAACDPEGAICAYDGLACRCTRCPRGSPVCMGGPTMWDCDAPNPDPSCPEARPSQGAVCSPEGQECTYGCETDMQRVCTSGFWVAQTAPGGCPRSSRRVKRDIRYLPPAEVDALAHVVDGTRLATYHYTDPALAERERLGFIIEDQPASYSVDPERSQVDLYGYTSMLVAAVQAQNRRIEALERELMELQSER